MYCYDHPGIWGMGVAMLITHSSLAWACMNVWLYFSVNLIHQIISWHKNCALSVWCITTYNKKPYNLQDGIGRVHLSCWHGSKEKYNVCIYYFFSGFFIVWMDDNKRLIYYRIPIIYSEIHMYCKMQNVYSMISIVKWFIPLLKWKTF